MKRGLLTFAAIITAAGAFACTNLIVTAGASADGSVMVSYAADSHQLYGALYHTEAGKFKPGTMLKVYEWDTSKYLGDIAQAERTYSTIGNMNEHQLIIGETTYGGRAELGEPNGIMDYGSLIYIALQRAKTARQAIEVIADLANTYGYASSGESFSIADKNEAWIMELIGKGADEKGIVWVARRIPDGYISAHANQAPKGMVVYGVGIGLLTVIIRYFGAYPEGMSFAILIMNAVNPLICNWCKPKRFGSVKK